MIAVCGSLLTTGCAMSGVNRLLTRSPLSRKARQSKSVKKLQHPVKTLTAAGRFQESIGNLTAARESYELALGEDPKSADAVLGLARLDQLAGRSQEAEQGYRKALKIKPNDPRVLDTVGQFYASQERWTESAEILTRAMQASPEDKTIRHHLAISLARSGNTMAAMPHFARAIGDAEAHYNVGLILFEQGKVDDAQQQFLQAVIKKPDLEQAQYWLDEIRREHESKAILSAGPKTAARYEELPPPVERQTHPTRLANHAGQPQIGIQAAGHTMFPQIQPQKPGTVPQLGVAPPKQPVVDLPVIGQPQLPNPATMTPEQLEQWKNQLQAN